jgi:hypothetical protein
MPSSTSSSRTLSYNEAAEAQLRAVRTERKVVKKKHKIAFDRLSQIQQVAYTAALVRGSLDDQDDPGFSPDELETEYHKDLHRIGKMQLQIYAHRALEDYVPLVAAFGAMIISTMMLFKGLENLHLELSIFYKLLIALMIAAGVWIATSISTKALRSKSLNDSTYVIFSWLQVFTAAGFAAAAVVMAASVVGIPVSSTHILIGAVLGVGQVNRNANWVLMKPIALAWVITLPAAAILGAIFLVIFLNIF